MRRIAIPLIALAAAACGGSGSSGPTEAPLNITASGIASNTGSTSITIPVGGRVHYFNKDTVRDRFRGRADSRRWRGRRKRLLAVL